MTDTNDKPKFQIFRVKDAKSLEEAGNMDVKEFTPEQMAGIVALYDPELARGDEVKVLFNIPGFNLSHIWFKKNYPLPRHSHDCDCLYYIIAGSLQLGTEELGPRDGFFISADVPYTYTPGPEGVELLEFRHATEFDFKMLVQGEAFWTRAVDTARANSADWRTATMPPLNV